MRFLAPSVSLLPLQLVLPGDESLLFVALSLRPSGINDYTNKPKLRVAVPALNKPVDLYTCMSVRTWACVCVFVHLSTLCTCIYLYMWYMFLCVHTCVNTCMCVLVHMTQACGCMYTLIRALEVQTHLSPGGDRPADSSLE